MSMHTPPRSQGTASLISSVMSAAAIVEKVTGTQTDIVNGVRTVRMNNHSHDNIYKGKFTYKSNAAPKSARYERLNCSHGTIADKDYTPVQSLVAKAALFVPNERSNWNWLAAYRNFVIDRMAATTPPGLQTVSLFREKEYLLVWQKVTTTLVNRSNIACEVTLYDLIAKQDSTSQQKTYSFPINNNVSTGFYDASPVGSIYFSVRKEGTVNTNYPTSTWFADITGADDLDLDIEKCRFFRAQWGICNKTTIVLGPGDQYDHTTFHRKNFLFNETKLADRGFFTNLTGGYLKGISTNTLVRAVGKVAHNSTTTTISGVYLDTLVRYSTYFREVLPFQDYFTLVRSGASTFDGEGNARSTVSQMEEDNPLNTTQT